MLIQLFTFKLWVLNCLKHFIVSPKLIIPEAKLFHFVHNTSITSASTKNLQSNRFLE